jgi:hypothetical protein
MPEHLSRERIAALLDGSEEGGPDREHIDNCEACTHEYEQMVRIRMALSAMPDLEPPLDEWDRIRDRVGPPESSVAVAGAAGTWPSRRVVSRPLWAAAVVALFAAGLGVGRQVALQEAAVSDRSAAEAGAAEFATRGSVGTDARDPRTEAYLRTVAEMERLRRDGTPSPRDLSDPAAATERLMKLDALIEASREALQTAPTDPALNEFLFDVVDERASLAGQLNRSLRYTSVEY